MAVITFLSDFGYRDHYVAAVKAKILSKYPEASIVDISHAVQPFNIAHAEYTLNSVYGEFPEGTIHLIAVDTHGNRSGKYHAAKYKGHYFLMADNGLLSLITDNKPDVLVELHTDNSFMPFPAKDLLASAAVFLAKGGDIEVLGERTNQFRQLLNRQLRLNDHAIMGHVVHVDRYGNLITNITRESIDTIAHGRTFTIHFGRETLGRIYSNYNQVDDGDCCCIYNSHGQLCIGINKGHAEELLGLGFDSQVDIRFYPGN
ncbi:S-adenosyl-l-methionine hydroxide adenosyltransferase family protein [Pontibacter silvestris]|uniref:S-adenosyl-l-methionine hydroxide adenosyltransferase family protein n=1 Tax=Pontibacter silvestris TaxID=2305183 RepID=A0ABW4X2C9_9BACT|nr:SAM-dependent chlorinase/fluorinase [Pontibacter silvestris]MCC9134878.1 SAM-dependent chlorinase/fluorinase [Pontibacter silvestris]